VQLPLLLFWYVMLLLLVPGKESSQHQMALHLAEHRPGRSSNFLAPCGKLLNLMQPQMSESREDVLPR